MQFLAIIYQIPTNCNFLSRDILPIYPLFMYYFFFLVEWYYQDRLKLTKNYYFGRALILITSFQLHSRPQCSKIQKKVQKKFMGHILFLLMQHFYLTTILIILFIYQTSGYNAEKHFLYYYFFQFQPTMEELYSYNTKQETTSSVLLLFLIYLNIHDWF